MTFVNLVVFLRSLMRTRTELAIENLALRQQLAALHHTSKRPRLRKRDRIFWAILSRIWPNWRTALLIVQPETVVRWHRAGFKLFWRWKSRTTGVGRPKIEAEIRRLIRQMSRENTTWGVPRIQSELAQLGIPSPRRPYESIGFDIANRHHKHGGLFWITI